jgi:hypothetical protein
VAWPLLAQQQAVAARVALGHELHRDRVYVVKLSSQPILLRTEVIHHRQEQWRSILAHYGDGKYNSYSVASQQHHSHHNEDNRLEGLIPS